MIVLTVTCRAAQHDTPAARLAGCVCPVEWGRPYRPPTPKKPPRNMPRGRVANRRGAHRSTVTEPDWVAVERRLAGDLTLVLAKVERDEAIDRLDRLGLSARQIAIRLGTTMRTVQRRRAERSQEDR